MTMLQKCAILGLILLLAGGLAYGWLYHETQAEREQARRAHLSSPLRPEEYLEKYGRWYRLSPEQQNQLVLEMDNERKSKTADELAREQQARLMADLNKLAAGQMDPGDIADFLYGRGWQDQVERYKEHKEQVAIVQTVSIVCLSIGGTLLGGCIVIGFGWLLVRAVQGLRQRSSPSGEEVEPEPPTELMDIQVPDSEPEEGPEEPEPAEQPGQRRRLLSLSEALTESPGRSGEESATAIETFFTSVTTVPTTASGPSLATQVAGVGSSVAVLLADEPAEESEWSADAQWSLQNVPETPSESSSPEDRRANSSTASGGKKEGVAVVENTLKEHAEDLQRQIAEFKQVAQDVQQATLDRSEPLSNTLKELTQQVSAIREYAASQQNRVEKLQDGYDWGIIRTFCLRVIRCIDNLEGRLADLPQDDGAVAHLEEVKDELIFALESSGVEQYRPEINSEFRGQEKLAEALKEKQPAKKPDQAGKIARVIRPGYRYMIDDENYRIVRTAQVKLFG